MTEQLQMVGCGNCGHAEPMTDALAELSFVWLDEHTSRTSCPACRSFTIQRAYSFDELGRPIAGEFLVVKTYNTILKGRNPTCKTLIRQ